MHVWVCVGICVCEGDVWGCVGGMCGDVCGGDAWVCARQCAYTCGGIMCACHIHTVLCNTSLMNAIRRSR